MKNDINLQAVTLSLGKRRDGIDLQAVASYKDKRRDVIDIQAVDCPFSQREEEYRSKVVMSHEGKMRDDN